MSNDPKLRPGQFELKNIRVHTGPIVAWKINFLPALANPYMTSVSGAHNLVEKVALVPTGAEFWLEILPRSERGESGLFTKRTDKGKDEYTPEIRAIKGEFASSVYFDSEQAAVNAAAEDLAARCKSLAASANGLVKPLTEVAAKK